MSVSDSARLENIEKMVKEMHDKLFVGNGQPSICAQVYGHALKLKLILWVGGTILGALVAATVANLWTNR